MRPLIAVAGLVFASPAWAGGRAAALVPVVEAAAIPVSFVAPGPVAAPMLAAGLGAPAAGPGLLPSPSIVALPAAARPATEGALALAQPARPVAAAAGALGEPAAARGAQARPLPLRGPADAARPVARAPGAAVRAVLLAREGGRAGDEAAGVPVALAAFFDGLSAEGRGEVLAGLEAAAKAEPQETALRRALHDLIVRDELERIEPRLRGVQLTRARADAVLAKTRTIDVRWWHHLTGSVDHPEAEGVTSRTDKAIALHAKRGWARLPDLAAHFRALFSHEYTHRLQYEGEATERYGAEIPAVATELLRAVELVGLDGLRRGLIRYIGEGQLWGFERGRSWMRSDAGKAEGATGFWWKGFLAGAAYELAQQTGRWADAWLFHRRVTAGEDPLEVERSIRSQ